MKKENLNEKLEKEKGKLHKLGEEAMKKGIPIREDEAFMKQNRKVDELVYKIQKEKEKLKKNQKER
ncbi:MULTISPECIES: hypothetical protein [Dehalobacter]|uniref:Uncharacterized protein n=2 Tax=Dehalobacter restrictus TaxID=55583 RepID=A0A857DE81_9FIRM|nr:MULTISPECIES: hypothetical protein [Dehalobacter]AHF09032.1 hypothetical protein DEHRE_02035 [Dehalobacter restrictus DSM 9455]MCG1024962.1 hypothetical protein [Dehalobacter sp.]QGZ99559.1 hypothetical protein GQ588_02275 [Dehalobacter restrictus]